LDADGSGGTTRVREGGRDEDEGAEKTSAADEEELRESELSEIAQPRTMSATISYPGGNWGVKERGRRGVSSPSSATTNKGKLRGKERRDQLSRARSSHLENGRRDEMGMTTRRPRRYSPTRPTTA
jgi:hypothetical protein